MTAPTTPARPAPWTAPRQRPFTATLDQLMTCAEKNYVMIRLLGRCAALARHEEITEFGWYLWGYDGVLDPRPRISNFWVRTTHDRPPTPADAPVNEFGIQMFTYAEPEDLLLEPEYPHPSLGHRERVWSETVRQMQPGAYVGNREELYLMATQIRDLVQEGDTGAHLTQELFGAADTAVTVRVADDPASTVEFHAHDHDRYEAMDKHDKNYRYRAERPRRC